MRPCALARPSILFGALLVLFNSAAPLGAYDGFPLWDPYDGEPIIESTGAQDAFAIDSDGSGGVVAAWRHALAGGIRVQRLNQLGAQQWVTPGGVQLSASGMSPAIEGDGVGGAIVAWSETTGIWVRPVDSSGVPLWAGPAKVGTTDSVPHVVRDGSGGVFVVWLEPGTWLTRLAHVNGSGTVTAPGVDGISLGAHIGTHDIDAVTDGFGGVIVAWVDASADIVAQRVNSGLEWGATPVKICSDAATGLDNHVRMASDGQGGALLTWVAHLGSANYQVRARRVNAGGTPLWTSNGVVLVDSTSYPGSVWLHYQILPVVTDDGAGGAIVAWGDWRNAPTGSANDDIFAQRVDSGGTVAWAAGGVLVPDHASGGTVPGSQRNPVIVSDGLGGAVIAFDDLWGPTWDIGGARLDIDGNIHWNHFVYGDLNPSFTQLSPQVVYDDSGPSPTGAIFAWIDNRTSGNGYDLWAQKLEISSPQNDDCADAELIGGGTHFGTLAGGTLDGSSSCGGTDSDVWYRWVAPGPGTLHVDTCGSHDGPGVDQGPDTVLSLHPACPGTTANEATCNDDWTSSTDPSICSGLDSVNLRDSAVELHVGAGEEVKIRVTRYAGSTNGPYQLNVGFLPDPPLNDLCPAAQPVGHGSWAGTLVGALTDGDASCTDPEGPDVWFSYTAPATGMVHINTCGSNDLPGQDLGTDTIISLHDGCPGVPDNEFAGGCNDDWPSGSDPGVCSATDSGGLLDSALLHPVTAGQTTWIRVARHFGSTDNEFFLHVIPEMLEAGSVPDGDHVPGTPLLLARDGTDLLLTWGPSCMSGDGDFSIYEGILGTFPAHYPIRCSTGGSLLQVVTPPTGNAYYLVVPHNDVNEGSYGYDSWGADRPPSPGACLGQALGACP